LKGATLSARKRARACCDPGALGGTLAEPPRVLAAGLTSRCRASRPAWMLGSRSRPRAAAPSTPRCCRATAPCSLRRTSCPARSGHGSRALTSTWSAPRTCPPARATTCGAWCSWSTRTCEPARAPVRLASAAATCMFLTLAGAPCVPCALQNQALPWPGGDAGAVRGAKGPACAAAPAGAWAARPRSRGPASALGACAKCRLCLLRSSTAVLGCAGGLDNGRVPCSACY